MTGFRILVAVLLASSAITSAFGQQNESYSGGLVDDWTSHNVIFSDPSTEIDAVMNGPHEQWRRIANDPRYRMQQIRRKGLWPGYKPAFAESPSQNSGLGLTSFEALSRRPVGNGNDPINVDWSVTLGGAQGASVPLSMYPAKYTSNPLVNPDCDNDFVVYTVNAAGSSANQANIVGVNNLYPGFCSGTVPAVKFSYYVGTGHLKTSPVLSEDGSKVAFIESIGGGNLGPYFHVLTLSSGSGEGNSGCPHLIPCNGTAYNAPLYLQPGQSPLNNAHQSALQMNGGMGADITYSSPYVDYADDIAYVGDDGGRLHKFVGVFHGNAVEVKTAPWPVIVDGSTALTSPVYDPVSRNVYIAGITSGRIYSVVAATGVVASVAKVGTGIKTGPIVDGTNGTVFVSTTNGANALLVQANTSLNRIVSTPMGASGIDEYNGAFDNEYYSNPAYGYMYFCGGGGGTNASPTLYRVGFNGSGVMDSSNDGNSLRLVATGDTGPNYDCTPLTEVQNNNTSTDLLLLGVKNGGSQTGCYGQGCIMSFDITSGFPRSAAATLPTGTAGKGTSGIIMDNISGEIGGAQMYYGDLNSLTGVQAAQIGLQ